jgi:hypothetical protein
MKAKQYGDLIDANELAKERALKLKMQMEALALHEADAKPISVISEVNDILKALNKAAATIKAVGVDAAKGEHR